MADENLNQDTSEFNEAVSKVQRIARLQDEANYYAKNGLHKDRFMILSVLYTEIYSKLTTDLREQTEKLLSEASVFVSNYLTAQNNYVVGSFVDPGHILFKLDCRIRELIDKTGYGSPNKANPKRAMAG